MRKAFILTSFALILFAGSKANFAEHHQTLSEENITQKEKMKQIVYTIFWDFPNVGLIDADIESVNEE